MKAIVFGGSGFLGSHVADVLVESGIEVKIFDLRPSPYLTQGQEMVIGDVLDAEAVYEAVTGCDWVFNYAGHADLDTARTNPVDTVTKNILGNVNVLEASRNTGVKRLVYASTVYVYSEKGGFYRCSKQASETYVEEYQRRYGLDFTILRYGTLYGPRADEANSVYRYLRQALTEGRVVAGGTGDERREYIHVRDAAKLTRRILEPEFANERVTITGHQSIYFRDFMLMVKEILSLKDVRFTGVRNEAHYTMTPYSYAPKAGLKLTINPFTELGQGLLECLAEIDSQLPGDDSGRIVEK